MELARTLRSRGIVVNCVLLSREERMFEGQEGAANYPTDIGVLEVLFLPKPETFSALEIVEQQPEAGGYAYSSAADQSEWLSGAGGPRDNILRQAPEPALTYTRQAGGNEA
jgi:hypothetical protein